MLRTAIWLQRTTLLERVLGCTLLLISSASASARAVPVVTDHIVSEAGHAQTAAPITFGQVFKDGDVPKGSTVAATLDGQPIALQVDAKATNPDGSLRHAVLSLEIPALKGHATLPLALSSTPAPASSRPAISLAQLLATGYDAKVSLAMKDGTTFVADVRPLLEAAAHADDCKAWNRHCNLWLSGPVATEWVVNGPVKTADGTANPALSIYFAVRAYAGDKPGSIGRIRTDIIVENTNAFAPQAQPQYTATLTSGSASYTSPALTQYTATRWHKVLWWNAQRPDVYLRQDTQYIQDTKAVSRYMKLTPDAKFLAGVRQSCSPLEHCDQTQGMGNTGAQPAIGPLPRWTSVYIIDPDIRAYRWMLANTDALGAYSIHYRDDATGYPLSIERHPYSTIIAYADARRYATEHTPSGRRYRQDLLPTCTNDAVVTTCDHRWYVTGNPNQWDNAHQPAWAYVAYMVTGSWYYMSELALGASYNEVWSNPSYRDYSKGLIDVAHPQVRGKAWTLRTMADAAWLIPDHYPLKAEFNADVNNSIADWNHRYTNNPSANRFGLMDDGNTYSLQGGTHNATSPWMHAFLVWAVNHTAELGFAGSESFRNWLAKFEIGVMTSWQANPKDGYCWLEAAPYNLVVLDSSRNYLPSFGAMYSATYPSLKGLACNSPAMIQAMSKLYHRPWRKGEMNGYADSATGFPSNLQIGLAAIADSGLPEAANTWEIFESRTVKPDGKSNNNPMVEYKNYPNFAIVPRYLPRAPTARR